MILVDSCVWIDAYNRANGPNFNNLKSILMNGNAATTDVVMLEVLQGFKRDHTKRYNVAKGDLDRCIYLPIFNKTTAIDAANNYRILRSQGVTPRSSIDVLIATLCINLSIPLLTDDISDFGPMTQCLGLDLIRE